MSSRGNVVVNWLDHQGQLLELEFHPNGIDYFVERTGEEGSSGVESQDFGVLLDRVANPLVA